MTLALTSRLLPLSFLTAALLFSGCNSGDSSAEAGEGLGEYAATTTATSGTHLAGTYFFPRRIEEFAQRFDPSITPTFSTINRLGDPALILHPDGTGTLGDQRDVERLYPESGLGNYHHIAWEQDGDTLRLYWLAPDGYGGRDYKRVSWAFSVNGDTIELAGHKAWKRVVLNEAQLDKFVERGDIEGYTVCSQEEVGRLSGIAAYGDFVQMARFGGNADRERGLREEPLTLVRLEDDIMAALPDTLVVSGVSMPNPAKEIGSSCEPPSLEAALAAFEDVCADVGRLGC